MNEKVISYGDVLLRTSDVELLTGPYWINDKIIEFYFEYLNNEFLQSRKDIFLVNPSVSFWVTHAPNEETIESAIAPLNLHQKEVFVYAFHHG